MRTGAGAAAKLLRNALVFGLLTACGQQPAPPKPEPARSVKSEMDEVHSVIAATKQQPKKAGPPMHVDPYPHSAGMQHGQHAQHPAPAGNTH